MVVLKEGEAKTKAERRTALLNLRKESECVEKGERRQMRAKNQRQ